MQIRAHACAFCARGFAACLHSVAGSDSGSTLREAGPNLRVCVRGCVRLSVCARACSRACAWQHLLDRGGWPPLPAPRACPSIAQRSQVDCGIICPPPPRPYCCPPRSEINGSRPSMSATSGRHAEKLDRTTTQVQALPSLFVLTNPEKKIDQVVMIHVCM